MLTNQIKRNGLHLITIWIFKKRKEKKNLIQRNKYNVVTETWNGKRRWSPLSDEIPYLECVVTSDDETYAGLIYPYELWQPGIESREELVVLGFDDDWPQPSNGC